MFFLADKLHCFALFEDAGQPVKELSVSPEVFRTSQFPGPVMSAVELWIGTIVIWLDQPVKVVWVVPA